MRLSLLRHMLRLIYESLVALGTFHTGVEPKSTATALPVPTPPPAPLTGPGRAHPERVCPDVPLTELELELKRELQRD